jgi:hypothetical protein
VNLAGRAIQRSGNAPVTPAPPARVALGGPLRGVYLQAQGGPIEVSWNGTDWISVAPGPAQHFLVADSMLLIRAAAAARYTALGILV